MKDIDMFISTHKDFVKTVNDESYRVMSNNDKLQLASDYINCNHEMMGLDDKFFSEIYMYDYVAKNIDLRKYVGFCHYRKYFSFLDNIPNMDDIFSKHDVVLAKSMRFMYPVKRQYELCHNIDDLMIVGKIIKEKYNEYADAYDSFINGNTMHPCNMFIMKKEDFLEYMGFINGVLNEYVKMVGTDIYKRINDNKDKYIKKFYPNNTAEYQYRIGGYLAERLTNVFVLKKFKNVMTYPIIVTEKKYPSEKRLVRN